MEICSRTSSPKLDAVTREELAAHLGIDETDAARAMAFARIAAVEIETGSCIALINQEITAMSVKLAGDVLALPIGPFEAGARIKVDMVEQDEPHTAIQNFHVVAGLHPVLHLGAVAGGRVRAVYVAGFGEDPADIPADLKKAILDHAKRLYDTDPYDHDDIELSDETLALCRKYFMGRERA